jgi:hypothetical protein
MPKIDAYGKDFRDLDGLLGSCDENGSLVPGHEPLKAELAAAIEKTRALKLQQESLEGKRLAATDRFLDALKEAKEQQRKLRGFIISILGTESPLLVLFGIFPKTVPNPNNRRRPKRKAKPETPAPTPVPEGPTPKPQETAKPAA